MTHTYITSMPDKPGAFMAAAKIIEKNKSNITRVSYNKSVDFHMLFIEVQGKEHNLKIIEKELNEIGYINRDFNAPQIIVINIKIPDKQGALVPVLEILNNFHVNISYLDSLQENKQYQNFKMGLFIDSSKDINEILHSISSLYPVEIVNYEDNGTTLDNTIFYIRFGNEIQKMFNLDYKNTQLLIQESNRIMQLLCEIKESPRDVFAKVLHLAKFISDHKCENFHANVSSKKITDKTTLYIIEPPCGSNVYIFQSGDELLFIDTGFAIYADEMMEIFKGLFENFSSMKKTILLTHADVDHCGLLSILTDAKILVNEKTAKSLMKQSNNVVDYREMNKYCLGYSRLSRIFSNYVPPKQNQLTILDSTTPKEHNKFIHICDIAFKDISLEMHEGSGGHMFGEVIFLCKDHKLMFTGDLLVNIKGFSGETMEFNSIAPYLMTSVDLKPDLAKSMRLQIFEMLEKLGKDGYTILGGHGPIMEN